MRQKLRVWFPSIHGGSGVDVHTRRLAIALDRYGVGATISWFSSYFQFLPSLLTRIHPPPDTSIVHALSWSGFAFKRPGLPLVVSEQLDVLDPIYRQYKNIPQALYHNILVRHFMTKSFAAASAVTTVSQATALSLKRSIPDISTRVIPNFINTDIFRPPRAPVGVKNKFTLLFVGNLTRRKGADLLAPIMKQLGTQFELRFTTGLRDGGLRDISPNMVSIGKLTSDQDLAAAYHECDALLFPSRLEGLPIAPLEAMACGLPIIAAHVSSMPEVVDNGITGILCRMDDIDHFVAACRTLADSPETRLTMAAAARARAEKLFAESVVVPQYVDLYDQLSGAPSRNTQTNG